MSKKKMIVNESNIYEITLSINIPDYIMELVVLIRVELPSDNTSWSIKKKFIADALSFGDELDDLEFVCVMLVLVVVLWFGDELDDLELEIGFLRGGLKNDG